MSIIDLRSDTVTHPTEAMQEAMSRAELGDDGREGDPTVRKLESLAAQKVGKQAAVYLPSGTMANLCSLLTHTTRGTEVLLERTAHIISYENSGLSLLGGLFYRPIMGTRGAMAANRPIVEVLHFVGAQDRYIANRFLRHFLRLGLEGGLIGGLAAMLTFGFSESIASWFSGTPVGDQFAALLGTFALPASGYLVLAAQTLMIAAVTATGSARMGTSAERVWKRKRMMTNETTTASSSNVRRSDAIDSPMSQDRS